MKKFTLIWFLIGMYLSLGAQTWSTEIQRTDGKAGMKTLILKPGMKVIANYLDYNSDSVKESRVFDGIFISGSADSIRLRLNSVRTESGFTNGVRMFKTIPATCYTGYVAPDTNAVSLPLRQMAFLSCHNEKKAGFAEIGEPVILGSVLMIILSPLISYNFREGKLNTDRYKYWALGSTAGLVAGLAIPITFASIYKKKSYQFREGWPSKQAIVWKFR